MLDSFNKPKSALGKRPQPQGTHSASASASPAPKAGPAAGGPSAAAEEGGEEFEAQLIEGMESLLRQLANENPPGPMAGETSTKADAASPKKLSAEEEEKAFQQALEAMLSGEGLEALGMDKKGGSSSSSRAPPRPDAKPTSFEETIKKAMENINQGGSNAGGGSDGMPGDLAALLQQLSTDPSALDGLEGLGDDDDELGGLLDGMMAQLMSKEVLEEPMAELAQKVSGHGHRARQQTIVGTAWKHAEQSQYPEYLANPPKDVSAADLEKYKKQHDLVKQICDVFKRPNYEDSTDGKEVARLVGEMQDLGGPPNEIMGELPEGFDLGSLAGAGEGCVVM